ncbi:MAG: hypothetical protein QM831_24365 [Kofleriaceae bacterium]
MSFKVVILLSIARVAFAQEAPAAVETPPAEQPAPVEAPPPAPVEQPAPAPVPVVVQPPPPPVRTAHVDEDHGHHGEPGDRSGFVALELGAGNFADGNNIYNHGLGRGIVAGIGNLEIHFEQYDLQDRSNQFTNVAHADGIASITSVAYRVGLVKSRYMSVSGVVGLALLSRPSMIQEAPDDPDLVDFGFTNDYVTMSQWGVGAVLGGGVTLLQYFYADVRVYPTAWSSMAGMRYEMPDGAMTSVMTPVTKDNTPGGMPITFNVGIGYGF